jgi:hypothetical protein
MAMKLKIPDELDFLNHEIVGNSLTKLVKKFTLLRSSFSADLWIIEGLQYPINFRIQLADNSQLTDPKNSEFLLELKSWIAIQQALPENNKDVYTSEHILKRIKHVLRIIDYFLLSDDAKLLALHGTSALTINSFRSLAYRLCKYNCVEEQIYDWSNRLRAYLIEHYSRPHVYEDTAIAEHVDYFEPFRNGFSLDLTDEQIFNIRRNLYLSSPEYLSTLKNRPKNLLNPIRLALYKNTLYGERLYKLPAELKILSSISNLKEMESAPIRSKHNQITRQNFSLYMSCLKSLEKIHQYGLRAPADSIFKGIDAKWLRNLIKSEPNRYRSVPFSVGMYALRNSIEYFLKYGEDILNATANVMIAAKKQELNLINTQDITPYLSEKLKNLGIKTWSTYKPNATSEDFTELLRANTGLYEAYLVLIGAAQVMLGLLSARRYAEIQPVRHSNLDQANYDFIFQNCKSGIGDKRATLARPIPPICIKMLNLLSAFHNKLAPYKISTPAAKLLSLPSRSKPKFKSPTEKQYYEVIDLFCDYAQIPTNSDGQRYYLREHQLRRFFAQAFFWSSLGNLHTLRWMLGQTDPEHVYRYISDNEPGEVLTDVKAEFVTEVLLHGNHPNLELERVVAKHFNTHRISILLEEEVREYISDLIANKSVSVEPHYFYTADGKSYDILIEVLHHDQDR